MNDILTFDVATHTFEQSTTAAPGVQPCHQNRVDWRGDYKQASETSLMLSYAWCTQSAPGCLSCETTREEGAAVSFSASCATLTLKHDSNDDRIVRAYDARKARSAHNSERL